MSSYANHITTIDASHDLSSAPHTFEPIKLTGENSLFQFNGSGMSGELYFEQSIDNDVWSDLQWIDASTSYTQLKIDLSDPSSNSIEISGYTPLQYVRPVLKTAGSGVLEKIKCLTS